MITSSAQPIPSLTHCFLSFLSSSSSSSSSSSPSSLERLYADPANSQNLSSIARTEKTPIIFRRGSMRGSEKNKCNSSSHQFLKDKAKNRVNCLQGMLTDLQSARKESRMSDINVLEEQVHLMLREWNAELNEPSPASSLNGGSLGSFSALLQLCEEQDDATSALAEQPTLKPDPDAPSLNVDHLTEFPKEFCLNQQQDVFQGFDQCKGFASGFQLPVTNNTNLTNQFDYNQFDLPQNFDYGLFEANDSKEFTQDVVPSTLPNVCPPPSAFLGPKCGLWDCPRPAQGLEWYLDFCSSDHAILALNEGCPGVTPVLRPRGIWFKDGQLFTALSAKTQGKNVGIPECEGAATTRSPWNAPELFDLNLFEGETIREWLFFDKPRRAFESGNRKQRSLPDYSGRGWHESRKLVVKEFEGQKRSYYMDPQPQNNLEWHLFEYEINGCDACALYRLELKLVDGKKSPKGKVATNDSLADLQKKMGRLTAEVSPESGRSGKGKSKANKKGDAGNVKLCSTEPQGCGLNGPYNHPADN